MTVTFPCRIAKLARALRHRLRRFPRHRALEGGAGGDRLQPFDKARREKFAKFDALASWGDKPIKPERMVAELARVLPLATVHPIRPARAGAVTR